MKAPEPLEIPADEPKPEPIQVDAILSWDKRPQPLKEIYGDSGRTYARVASVDQEETGLRYARLNMLRARDYQDFDCRTLEQRIKAGQVQVEDPYLLLSMIADVLQSTDPVTAQSILAALRSHDKTL